MRFLKSEAGAVVFWVISSILLAAAIVPWIYNAGMDLAAEAQAKELSPILESIGKSAARADLDRYFSRALLLSVLVLLPVFLLRLRQIRRSSPREASVKAEPLPWKTRLLDICTAFVIAAGSLWILGTTLQHFGAFFSRPDAPAVSKLFSKAVIPALGAAVVEEWLFRGLLLGIWLRVAKPVPAIVGTSLLFAFVHFMQPPADAAIANPGQIFAGFHLLGLIFLNFTDPGFIAAEFAVLFTLGLLLASTRVRTGSLWFPIGLHAGLVFAFKAFNLYHKASPDSALRPLWIGDSLRSGVLPVLTLLVMGLICWPILRNRGRVRK
ncbi:CPBP family intramembrane metalloprotease [Luteolibacter pohnpeiensis]|uniref:CPBP family intramembrane metalloprotease n=1 Tax=Luteolibacter pohnpeiensis TaxID=454153 RepID=A0A934S8A1_9BACT|nr:CPBP family intramembrane glutamic endopeptidase [Luteolibacter pohnpeiensis]MBK1883155.1 CPBP family intramembrane metalloprotease [Luteolibacter pohnpeiensis]